MASTYYINTVTHVLAEWANDTNRIVYDILGNAHTQHEAQIALGLDQNNVNITGGKINGTTIGIDNPSTAQFHWAIGLELPVDPTHLANKRYVDSLFGGAGGNLTLTQDVPVIGTSVGAIDAGYTFLQGTTFTEFVILISQRVLPPGYTAPTITIAAAPGTYEYGSNITVNITSSFAGNDSGGLAAGTPGSFHFFENGSPNATTPQNAPTVNLVALATTHNFTMTADYLQGPIKNDNFGNPNPSGRINAGTANSNTLAYVPKRLCFYGFTAGVDSASVRSEAFSTFSWDQNNDVDANGVDQVPAPSPNFVITIPPGSSKVVIAYPATVRSVASIRYQELANSEVKGNFVETSVMVQGANGFTAVAYRVLTYTPVEPFSITNHYKVFI